jgi:iron complex outermembrane receptor protein
VIVCPYAILTQVSGEYRGEWADGRIITTVGIRAPFFKRDLNNNCFTSSDTGFVECFGSATDPRNATYAGLNPTIQGPQQRVLKYDDILPNVGLMFKPNSQMSVFANYSKGLQVPGTDALYNAFFFAPTTASARPVARNQRQLRPRFPLSHQQSAGADFRLVHQV